MSIRTIAEAGPIPSPPKGHTWHNLMGLALEEAELGEKKGEVPVGAVIISMEGNILAKAHNACIHTKDPTAHAEILALRAAGLTLQNYRLQHTIMVVTLEPCLMCAGALVHARVSGLVYGAADTKAGAISSCCDALKLTFLNHSPWHMGGIRSAECAKQLTNFFEKTRIT